jgi:hypothetical protein
MPVQTPHLHQSRPRQPTLSLAQVMTLNWECQMPPMVSIKKGKPLTLRRSPLAGTVPHLGRSWHTTIVAAKCFQTILPPSRLYPNQSPAR